MPIYAYKCESCGFAKDVLQKFSDQPLAQCPSCQAATFKKQVTAAGFQLKGSGWYATDFKGSGSKPADSGDAKPAASDATAPADSGGKTESSAPAPAKADAAPSVAAGS